MGQDPALILELWHDGALAAAERTAVAARLRSDSRFAAEFFAELRFSGQLLGALRQPNDALWQRIDDALAIAGGTALAQRVLARLPSRPRAARSRGWWWLAGAAAVLLVGILAASALHLPERSAPAGITIAMQDERGDQAASSSAATALPVACDNDHHAELAFPDGSHVDVGAGSTVAFVGHDHGGTRLGLDAGSLQVEVAKQQGGARFVVQTREAVLTALGTRFTALRFPWGTRLEVGEGRVLAHQLVDGAEIEVPAGMRVDIRKRAGGMLMTAPLARPLPAGAQQREPVADAIVVAGRYAHENRGSCVSHILTSPDAPLDERREFFLRFDLSGVSRPVAAAHLILHLNQLTHAGMRLEVDQVTDTHWQEKAITWATRPLAGATLGEWHPGPEDAPIDLTAAVNAAGDQLSLCIRAVAGTPPHAVVGFSTREAIAHKRPRLVLEALQPLP